MVFNGGNTGTAKLVDRNTSTEAMPVDVITVSEMFTRSNVDRFDLIKIDVEGHEAVVLKALASTIEHDRPAGVVFEHGADLRDKSSPIRQQLDTVGYGISAIHKRLASWKLIPIDEFPAGTRLPNDYLATPTKQ